MSGCTWSELGELVAARRNALGMRAEDLSAWADHLAGRNVLSVATIGKLENGKATGYRPSTFTFASRALDWPSSTIDELLAGIVESDPLLDLPPNPDRIAWLKEHGPADTATRVGRIEDRLDRLELLVVDLADEVRRADP